MDGMTTPDITVSAQPRYARVLTIAGSDSGGGAGIQADLKTFAALGCYGMTAITALTAQNTVGVQGIHAVPPAFLRSQLQSVIEDIGVDAVKIGMLHEPGVVEVVAWAIQHYQLQRVVLDPVMVATSGDRLIADATVRVLVDQLFPLATVITPNLDEASLLLGRPIAAVSDLSGAAQALLSQGARRYCSRADTCRVTRWSTCWPVPVTSMWFWRVRAWPAATPMARDAPCRRPSLRTWPWGNPWSARCERHVNTSSAQFKPVQVCKWGTGMDL